MSDDRDQLRGTLANAVCNASNYPKPAQPYLLGGDMSTVLDKSADAVLAAGYRKPQQVTTVEELDALPFGSIIRDYEDDAWQKFIRGWEVTGGRSEEDSPTLPATVLHVGGSQ